MDMAAFLALHRDLPREGPGEPADVAWAARLAGTRRDASILDAGAGPGGDIAALLAVAPEGRVTAVDGIDAFVRAARARFAGDPRVRAEVGDMAAPGGRYDLIWSAGAVYFLGVTEALEAWRAHLAPQGAVAFSEVCWLTDEAPEHLRAHWSSHPAMTDAAGIEARIAAAGYRSLGARLLSDAAWEAYYTPLERRAAALRPGAGADLAAVLDEAEAEIALWRAHRRAFGYRLSVVRPA